MLNGIDCKLAKPAKTTKEPPAAQQTDSSEPPTGGSTQEGTVDKQEVVPNSQKYTTPDHSWGLAQNYPELVIAGLDPGASLTPVIEEKKNYS